MKTKKDWKAEYKQMRFAMGVFRIVHLASGQAFVGSGLNLPALFNRHRFQLELGTHPCHALQAQWREEGAEAFSFEIVAELKPDAEGERDYRDDVAALEALYRQQSTARLFEGG